MSTIRDLITGSLRLIEEVGAGETASAESCADGLTALNAMLGSWSIQGDLVFTETTETFSLTSGQSNRTIGPTGNYVTTRPNKIIRATVSLTADDSYDLRILGMADYAEISDKTLSGEPEAVYYDGNFPNGTLYFWPVPSTTYGLVIYSEKSLSEYSSINDTLTVPPGYERAFRYNLAVEIAPEYGKSASPDVKSIAISSKSAIQAQNNQNDIDRQGVDPALMRWNGFDILTGRYR